MRPCEAVLFSNLALLAMCRLAGATEGDVDWISQHGGTLELELAHDHDETRLDVGVLRIDPMRRVVIWEGLPGEHGCKLKIEAPFDNVKSVRVNASGFLLELRPGKEQKLLFAPLPDASWLWRGTRVAEGTVGSSLRMPPLTGPGRPPMIVAGETDSAVPRTQHLELPAAVRADFSTAVGLIRDALGRVPSPNGALQEVLYGRPLDVSVTEVLESPAAYLGRAVRLRGRIRRGRRGEYTLADEGNEVCVTPLRELAALVAAQLHHHQSHDVEIAGAVQRQRAQGAAVFCVAFWDYDAPDDLRTDAPEAPRTTSLEELVTHPGVLDGQLIRVVGRFRGRRFGDLPQKDIGMDWVIKAGEHALVVKGKRPSGPGFDLDPYSEADAMTWVEVHGRPETRDGLTIMRAVTVALTVPPPYTQAPRPILRPPTRPTVIVFALPVEGEQLIAADSRFAVQFSNYMDEDSFQGHVHLRYTNGREFQGIKWRYNDERRALLIDPGETLEPGRQLELLLLSGIRDAQGSPLVPRVGDTVDGAVERLRYEVGG